MERDYLKIGLALVIILFIAALIWYFVSSGLENNPDINPGSNINKPIETQLQNNTTKANLDESTSSNNNGDNYTNQIYNELQLPLDINTSNCGTYYSQYNVCAGICPEGKCVSEERSCYCKRS